MNQVEIIVLVVYLSLLVVRLHHLFVVKNNSVNGDVVRPWLQYLQLGLFILLMILSSIELMFMDRQPIWLLNLFALGIIVVTQVIKVWGKKTLRNLWSAHVIIESEHELVRTGPYAFIRHPSYLNGILEALLVPVIAGSWLTLGFAVIFVPFVFALRIKTEEKALEEKFGKEYVDYCRETPRFLNFSKMIRALRKDKLRLSTDTLS